MEKVLFVILLNLFVVPYFGSIVLAESDIQKTKYTGELDNVEHSDIAPDEDSAPVSIELNKDRRTIYILFGEPASDVDIKIYCNGRLAVRDKETVTKSTIIGYTFTGAEQSDCSVIVATNGQTKAIDNMTIE